MTKKKNLSKKYDEVVNMPEIELTDEQKESMSKQEIVEYIIGEVHKMDDANPLPVKPKTGRGGTENFPNVLTGRPADVRRVGMQLMRWYRMDKAVTDDEIAERLELYFTTCFSTGEIPTWEAMRRAVGYDRKTMIVWETGGAGSTPRRRNLIKKAKELLASYDATMVTDGKLNPVTYIFRSKNYFGMKDQQDYVLTPNNPLGEARDPDEIKKRLDHGVSDV